MESDSLKNATATSFLSSLLNKNLRVTTHDTRMFLGQFKCTDSDSNIILAYTHEYRLPQSPFAPATTSTTSTTTPSSASTPRIGAHQTQLPEQDVASAQGQAPNDILHTSQPPPPVSAAAHDSDSGIAKPGHVLSDDDETETRGKKNTRLLDMTSRYVGLVVVPGQHIAKIEVEEFASQMPAAVAAATG